MAPKHHPTPLSGSLQSALEKELAKSSGFTLMLARQSEMARATGEYLIRHADSITCRSCRLRCEKCKKAGKRPVATLLQLAPRARHDASD